MATELLQEESFVEWVERRRRAVFLVAIIAALFWTAIYFQFSVDDAYISYRYGKTLVANHVWNWNPAGPREEAYTSAAYTALSIVPALIKASPAIFFKVVGLLCIALLYLRLRSQSRSLFAYLLAVLVLSLDPWVWVHSYSGLETPLYILAILELALCVERSSSVSSRWVYSLALLLPLIRPEGVIFAVAGVVLYRRQRGAQPKQTPLLIAAILAGIAYFIARWAYFHQLLPNPFYVKVEHESARAVLGHLLDSLTAFKGYVLCLVLVVLLARKPVTRIFGACALFLLLALFFPHDMPMNYADRYPFQVCLPVVLLFFIVEDVRQSARIAALTAGIFLFSISPAEILYNLRYFPGMLRAHVDIGKRLAPFADGHTLLAGDVGVIPYYSDWQVYDFAGLATGQIARHGLNEADLRQLRPDVIILYNGKSGPGLLYDGSWAGPEPEASAIVKYIRDSEDYTYASASRARDFYLVSFVRNGTPQFDEIVKTLQENGDASERDQLSAKKLLEQRYVPW